MGRAIVQQIHSVIKRLTSMSHSWNWKYFILALACVFPRRRPALCERRCLLWSNCTLAHEQHAQIFTPLKRTPNFIGRQWYWSYCCKLWSYATPIPSNTTTVYFKASCAFTCMLLVSALCKAIIKDVNTNSYKGRRNKINPKGHLFTVTVFCNVRI